MFRSISRVFFVLICVTGANVAMAIVADKPSPGLLCRDKACGSAYVTVNNFSSCSSNQYKTACYGGDSTYGNVKVYSCVSCPSGYKLTGKTGTADESASTCEFRYSECEKVECNKTCAIGLPRWTMVVGTNYQTYTSSSLNKDECECVTYTKYRCNAGYYMEDTSPIVVKKEPASYKPPCRRCPRALDKGLLSYGTSKAGYNAGISSCYIDKSDSYSHKVQEETKINTIGKYRLSVDCHYKQPAN